MNQVGGTVMIPVSEYEELKRAAFVHENGCRWRSVTLQEIMESEGDIQILAMTYRGKRLVPRAVAYRLANGNYVMAVLPKTALQKLFDGHDAAHGPKGESK